MKEIFFNNIGLTCNFAELIEKRTNGVKAGAISRRGFVKMLGILRAWRNDVGAQMPTPNPGYGGENQK